MEANLLNKNARLKALTKDRIEKEHLISLEMKLDILTNTVNEVVHNISRKEELSIQKTYVPLVPERKKIKVPNIFLVYPRYSDTPNDYFMYSIHDIAKDEVQNQMVIKKPPEMMSMFDEIAYVYDDYMVYIEVDCSNQPTLSSGEEEAKLSQ
jgi:hypothetical protein